MSKSAKPSSFRAAARHSAQLRAARRKGVSGAAEKLDITIDSVRLASGEKAALRAVRTTKGRDNTGAMTAGIVATGFLFFPAAPFFLFIKGRDITIPKGTDITAYINGDTPLDAGKFAPLQTAETASTGQNSNAGFSTVFDQIRARRGGNHD